MKRYNNHLKCPDCHKGLVKESNCLYCPYCKRKFYKKNDIFVLLPSVLDENKASEDRVHTLNGEDNSWYNHQIWYYFIHLSSHIVRFEQEFLPKVKGPRVLELACGNSWASLLVKRKNPSFKVFATDVSFHCLDIQARQMSKIMEVRSDFLIACDAESLPFEDNFFDTVFIVASLHHFQNIERVLAEAKRVLKPGGSFIAIDGMMPVLAQKLLGDEGSERTRKYGILERKLTYTDWRRALKKAGFSTKSLTLNYDSSYIHEYATNADERKIIRKSWVFNVAKEIIYQALLSRIPQKVSELLRLTSIFPAGVVINYRKPKR